VIPSPNNGPLCHIAGSPRFDRVFFHALLTGSFVFRPPLTQLRILLLHSKPLPPGLIITALSSCLQPHFMFWLSSDPPLHGPFLDKVRHSRSYSSAPLISRIDVTLTFRLILDFAVTSQFSDTLFLPIAIFKNPIVSVTFGPAHNLFPLMDSILSLPSIREYPFILVPVR